MSLLSLFLILCFQTPAGGRPTLQRRRLSARPAVRAAPSDLPSTCRRPGPKTLAAPALQRHTARAYRPSRPFTLQTALGVALRAEEDANGDTTLPRHAGPAVRGVRGHAFARERSPVPCAAPCPFLLNAQFALRLSFALLLRRLPITIVA